MSVARITVLALFQSLVVAVPSDTKAQGPIPFQQPAPSGDRKGQASSPSLDIGKLPPGVTYVLVPEGKDGALTPPQSMILPLDEYRKLMEQLESLQRAVKAEPIELPSSCTVFGKVEGEWAHLRLRFEARTFQAKTRISLGCLKGWASAVTLDGLPADAHLSEDGLQVLAPKPGSHVIELFLDLLIAARKTGSSGERGWELDLPRIAIMRIASVVFPGNVEEVRIGSRLHKLTKVKNSERLLESVPCGPGDLADVSWKAKQPVGAIVPPIRAANAKLSVRATSGGIIYECELVLRTLRGEAASWQVSLPSALLASAELTAKNPDMARLVQIERPSAADQSTWKISLIEPSAEPIHLRITSKLSEATGHFEVPLPWVVDALSLSGDIEVRSQPGIGVMIRQSGSVLHREQPPDATSEDWIAGYSFWLPTPADVPAKPRLWIEVKPQNRRLTSRSTYIWQLLPDKQSAGEWECQARLELAPYQGKVAQIVIAMTGARDARAFVSSDGAEQPGDLRSGDSPDRKTLVFAPASAKPIVVRIVARFDPSQAIAPPRVLAWQAADTDGSVDREISDAGATNIVQIPDGFELVSKPVRLTPWSSLEWLRVLGSERAAEAFGKWQWSSPSVPQKLDLSVRAVPLRVRVDSSLELTLEAGVFRALHSMSLEGLDRRDPVLSLSQPEGMVGMPRVIRGGRMLPPGEDGKLRIVVESDRASQRGSLLIEYKLLAQADAHETPSANQRVPLLSPVEAQSHRVTARIWSDDPILIATVDDGWLPTASTPERINRVQPIVQVVNKAIDEPVLGLRSSSAPNRLTCEVEQLLHVTRPGPNGHKSHVLLARLGEVFSRKLIVRLPAGSRPTELQAKLGDIPLPVSIIDPTDGMPIVEIALSMPSEWQSKLLRVSFVSPEPAHRLSWLKRERIELPVIRGSTLLNPPRVGLAISRRHVPLWVGDGLDAPQQWARDGIMWSPGPINPRSDSLPMVLDAVPDESFRSTILFLEESSSGDLWSIDRRVLIGCLSTVWLVAFVLSQLSKKLASFIRVLGGIAIALLLILAVIRPITLNAMLYGSQLAIMLLCLMAVLDWVWRRVVHKPAVFAGSKLAQPESSSILKRGGSTRSAMPSTADDPPRTGSSFKGPSSIRQQQVPQ